MGKVGAGMSLSRIVVKEAFSWAKMIVITVLIAVLLNQFVIVNANIPTASMENTIMTHDRIIAFRLSYVFSDPQRYDIIIFRPPQGSGNLYVKRIIGMPGETLEIIDGYVFINGSDTPQRTDFIYNTRVENLGPYHIPEGHYFVMGDNRGNSQDSRGNADPFISRESILGRAVFKYFRGIGLLD